MINGMVINLDEFAHGLTSWRHWNYGECMGNHPHSPANGRTIQRFSGEWIIIVQPDVVQT